MPESAKLQILLLLDEKPGHSNQVEGLAQIISEHLDVSVDRQWIRLPAFAKGRLRSFIARHARTSRGFWTRTLFGIELSALARPDLVITSGVKTLSAGRFIAQHFGAKLVNCGLAESDDRQHCTALLVPFTGCAWEPNMVLCPTPNLVDPGQLPAPRELREKADFEAARASLLLGGPSHQFEYTASEWRLIADLVDRSRLELGLQWTVSGSRRTPESASILFAELAGKGACRFFDYRHTGSLTAHDLYSADIVAVTEDSLSMFCEALASRRPVAVLRPGSVEPSLQDEIVEAGLLKKQACRIRIADLGVESFVTGILSVEPSATDYRDEIWNAVEPLVRSP